MEMDFEKWMLLPESERLKLIAKRPIEEQVLLVARELKRLDLHMSLIGVALANHPWKRAMQRKWIGCLAWTLDLMIVDGKKLGAAPLVERRKWMEAGEGFMAPEVAALVRQRLGIELQRRR